MRLNRIAAVFYCLIKCRLVQSRQICSLGIDAMTRKFNCLCERSEANSREGELLNRVFYLSLRGSEATKQTPGRVVFRNVYTISLKSWDISLTLNMTYFLSDNVYFRKIIFLKRVKTVDKGILCVV